MTDVSLLKKIPRSDSSPESGAPELSGFWQFTYDVGDLKHRWKLTLSPVCGQLAYSVA